MYKKNIIPCGIATLIMIDYLGVIFAHPSTKCLLGFLVLLVCTLPLEFNQDKKTVIRNISIFLILPSVLLYSQFIINNNIAPDLIIPAFMLLYLGISNHNIENIKNIPYITAIIYSELRLGYTGNPLVYNIINDFSRYISYILSFGLGKYGDSMGLLIPFLSIILALLLVVRGKQLIYSILISIVLLSIHCTILSLLLAYTTIGSLFMPIFVLLSLITYLVFNSKIHHIGTEKIDSEKPYLKNPVFLYVICILSVLTLVFNVVKIPGKNSREITIGILGGNEVDLHTIPTQTSNLGYASTNSLYGALPIYLKNSGFQVEIFDDMEQIDFDKINSIILINYNKKSTSNDKLESFVKKGGNLFVFADHTSLMGVRDTINPMIDFSGLFLRDDTSDDILFKKGNIWNNNLYSGFQPGFPSTVTQSEIQVWGGASVGSKNKFAVPILVGRYATSDPADINNDGIGGFLGNRQYDLGESAGDMILIIKSLYGKGKVVLFGDTSYVQTPVLASNWKYISLLFADITPNQSILAMQIIKTIIYIAFFATIIIIVLKYRIKRETIYYIIFACFITAQMVLIVNKSINDSLHNNLRDIRSDSFVYINDKFMNGIGASAVNNDSILGLGYISIKNQIPIMIDNSYRGKAVFLLNPNKSIPEREQKKLLKYISDGGILVIAIDKKFSPDTIMETLGVNITNQFLGPVPWRYPNIPETMKIEFPDFKYAWNLEILNDNITIPWLTYEDYILVTRTNYGSGLCYVFADRDFFQMSNLEGETTGNPFNIELVNKMFNEIKQH